MDPTGAKRLVDGSLPIALETRYRLALPDGEALQPWVLALHGYGESGARFLERLMPLVAAGCAVLAPDGPYPVELRTESPPRIGCAWYQYSGDGARFAAALDFTSRHLDRLIAHAESEHPLDPARLAILGYSQGGYLAGVFALARPAKARALVAIAARIKVELFEPAALAAVRFPVLAVHGRNDRHVALDPEAQSVEALRAAGVPAELLAHDGGHGLRDDLLPPIAGFLRRALDIAL
jgi:predicted esterase